MGSLLWTFVLLNILNVVVQTIKSLCTINCGKIVAAVANAVAYGLYTIVIVYTLCDLPLLEKALVVALCNLVGVFVVKWVEEIKRKDKLWKVEATVRKCDTETIHTILHSAEIPHNYISSVGPWTLFNCYCATQKESALCKSILGTVDAKYFVSESKNL